MQAMTLFEGYQFCVSVKDLDKYARNYFNQLYNGQLQQTSDHTILAAKIGVAASRAFSVGLMVKSGSNLFENAILKKLLIKKLVTKISELFINCNQITKKNWINDWNTKKDMLSIMVSILGITETINAHTSLVFERICYLMSSRVIDNARAIVKFTINPSYRSEALDRVQDMFLSPYDYLTNFFKKTPPLILKPLESKLDYDFIPDGYRKNKVFRRFKCYLTNKPVRYPVIVIKSVSGKPFQPMCLFERILFFNLFLFCNPNSSNPVYPKTREFIHLSDGREHLGVRNLIENEMKNLNIYYRLNN